MQKTKAQIQLQYHQTLNRICEIQLLAEQLSRLADSYQKEERGHPAAVREKGVYVYGQAGGSSGDILQEQALELKSVAEEWYRKARDEYRANLMKVKEAEEKQKTW